MTKEEREFLREFRSSLTEGVTWQELVAEGAVFSPSRLRKILQQAHHKLVTAPGPHLYQRVQLAPDWTGWWIDYLNNFQDKGSVFVYTDKLVAAERIYEKLKTGGNQDRRSGVIFMAGGEGLSGHRYAARYMETNVDLPGIVFDREETLREKTRLGSFLPIEVRLSMWNWLDFPQGLAFMSVMPEKRADLETNDFYNWVFRLTGADDYFFTVGDPHEKEKLARNSLYRSKSWRVPRYVRIPQLRSRRTTDAVYRLMPADRMEDLWEEIEQITRRMNTSS